MADELEVACAAARAGGAVVARHFRDGVTMRRKGAGDLVSDADTESERVIAETILARFPSHAVLGEETYRADASAGHLWIVDPLDGTTNFAHRIPHVAVSIAYYRGGVPQVGVIFNPLRDEWFTAVRGGGAQHDGRPARVSAERGLDEALLAVGFFYDRGAMMEATLATIGDLFRRRIHGVRRFGTAALDLCMVGTGTFGAFFEYRLAPWDFAAGRLFVEEAGGRVTTCRGEALPVAPSTVLASNGRLHEAMLEVVRGRAPAL
jgi:myo-inositol-1(or 4)-monophosphatase